jgi:Domain of unknown function (DUF4331)
MKSLIRNLSVAASTLGLAAVLAGCSSGGGSAGTLPIPAGSLPNPAPVVAASTTLTQVERLARPAINEGLLITNDFLNAFNAIAPTSDAAALGTAVGTEIVATLTALGNDQAAIGAIVNAFVPDVMRIDTTITSGYPGGVTFTGAAFTSNIASIPSGGRLILDDVIDITLTVLTHAAITSDNVSYDGGGNVGQGHTALSTSFPYLAPPH